MARATQRERLREIEVLALDATRLAPLIGPERMARYAALQLRAHDPV
jgi:hypothetical protein